jgi:uncharacterized protein YjbI with pentapeptide repeats
MSDRRERYSRENEWDDPPLCQFDGEGGCRAGGVVDGLCLYHLPSDRREAALDRVMAGDVVDLRFLRVDDDFWPYLAEGLESVASDAESRKTIWLSGAVFEVPAFFLGWRFCGSLNFDGAHFECGANFCASVFEKDVSFSAAKFMICPEKQFGDDRDGFSDLSAEFEHAIFKDSVHFNGAEFDDEARFSQARFESEVDLQGAIFKGQVSFQEVKWLAPQRNFGKFQLDGELDFRRASFEGDLLLEVDGGRINFEDTGFAGSLTIRARGSALALEHLDLTQPALVGLAPDSHAESSDSSFAAFAVDRDVGPAMNALPRIVSLRGSNVLALTISSADLRGCLFQGVRNIDRLSIEGHSPFASAPKRRSRRRIVYEESAWRLARVSRGPTTLQRRAAAFVAPIWRRSQARRYDAAGIYVQPDQLARIYRGLRKSLEDSKDYAGASDLYYGEMEMRMRASATPFADRMIIAIYWLLSGYGLRATRSLFALACVLAVFAGLFATVGFATNDSLLDGFLYSARTAALLPQSDGVALTQAGQAFQILLRVVGPALIALSALAVRARIKR